MAEQNDPIPSDKLRQLALTKALIATQKAETAFRSLLLLKGWPGQEDMLIAAGGVAFDRLTEALGYLTGKEDQALQEAARKSTEAARAATAEYALATTTEDK